MRRFVRFALVGLTGVGVNLLLYICVVDTAHWPLPAAAALATEGAITSNFLINDSWTFYDRRAHRRLHRFLAYNAVAAGGLVLSAVVVAVLTSRLHVQYVLANLVAVGLVVAWNYTGGVNLAWRTVARTGV